MILNFDSKVVLVAGGTGGLGRSVSLAFLAEGARTLVTYRTEAEYQSLREAAGPRVSLLEGRATAAGYLLKKRKRHVQTASGRTARVALVERASYFAWPVRQPLAYVSRATLL